MNIHVSHSPRRHCEERSLRRGNPGTTPLYQRLFCYALFSTLLFLSGCASHHKKDGPPSFHVDASKIPDAVPKKEPLSRIGNKPTYTVFGKKYYVLKSRKNYAAVGMASWYGTQFHNRHTSSGERYNMLSMTAAHRTLPLPTYAQVTNLENGRRIIVKINDRGPFEQNRLIDLSFAAAKKLEMAGRGTALVEVKALDMDKSARKILASSSLPKAKEHKEHRGHKEHKGHRKKALAAAHHHKQNHQVHHHVKVAARGTKEL